MTRAVEARIKLSALQHNLQRIRQLAPRAKIMAIIKANGYGHGMVPVARALSDADGFGVAGLEEALKLRQAGAKQPIVLLSGFFDERELEAIQQHNLEVVVHHEQQIVQLEQSAYGRDFKVWLKIDTGMHRLGIAPQHVAALWQRLVDCAAVASPLKLMSHLASADEPDSPQTAAQIACFDTVTQDMPAEKALANSAAIWMWPQSHYDWVRPGLMLYGVSPFADSVGVDHGLQPAMTLQARLIAINDFQKGDAIGYGASWVCPEAMSVGVVAIGYGDGYPRHAKFGTPVLINGRRVPLIGRVSMDSICVDLRTHRQVAIGDKVTLWGQDLPIEEIARSAETVPYELLCKLTQRVVFDYTA